MGKRIQVYWPIDDKYYPYVIVKIDDNGKHHIQYDYDDKKIINRDEERWEHDLPSVLRNNTSILTSLASTESDVTNLMFYELGSRPYLINHVSVFEQFPLVNPDEFEKSSLLKHLRRVSRNDVLDNANISNSHKIFKIKTNDDVSLAMKARIAPEANENSCKYLLRLD